LVTPLKEVILEISSKRLGAAAVVAKDLSLLGIITDGDLRRMLEKGIEINQAKAGDIFTKNPKTVDSGELAVKALQIMQQNSITQLVVIKENKVHGFIHLHDLLKEGIV
jgi:arabinose-5-phosphate isomerase